MPYFRVIDLQRGVFLVGRFTSVESADSFAAFYRGQGNYCEVVKLGV